MTPGFRGIFALGCVGSDLYLIVINHFHYTVDVVMAIVMTFLLYTNAGQGQLLCFCTLHNFMQLQD